MNTEADALSHQQDQAEWMLHRNVARKIFAHFGRLVVDLFASADTKQVHQYYTIDRHDPEALGTDAMHQQWDFNHQLLYAFPSPMLVPLVLVREHQFQATMILITPWWPRALWLPELMTLSIRLPRRLPSNNTTLLEATSGLPLAGHDKLKMTAWHVSADPSKRLDYPLKWPHSYGRHGSQVHASSTAQLETVVCVVWQ